jgi:hypothetical protein
MSKIIFWIVVVFAGLFALRLWNAARARSRSRSAKKPTDPAQSESMVQCGRCGVFLPQPDARATPDGYRCADPACASHGAR